MNTIISKQHPRFTYKFLSCCIAFTFLISITLTPTISYAQVQPNTVLNLPVPGEMVDLSGEYKPVIVKGMSFYPQNPLEFDFIVDTGDENLSPEALSEESSKLIKYFLASLTVPEEEMWVNLSPYENDRIIPENFGYTEMGRDLLAQDYLLKQLTASLIYPEEEIGEEFWDTVYERAYKEYGEVNIPVNTFNKIWIVPKDAVVAEKGNEVYVLNKHLKVMLEEDYIALQHNMGIEEYGLDSIKKKNIEELSGVSADVVREILIPAIEKEINTGKNFAPLRQIYNSMILATWFKKNLKESLLGKVYVDQNKVKGVDVEDKQIKQKIYNQYVEAFKKGVYNYVKEDYDPTSQQIIPRKYFSGGAVGLDSRRDYTEIKLDNPAITISPVQRKMAERVNRELVIAERNKGLQKVHFELLENAAQDDYSMAVSSAQETETIEQVKDQIKALQRELQDYQSVSTIDHLTQLPNRRAFFSETLKEIKRIQSGSMGRRRLDNLLAVYTADINEFKFFNELFGHDVGDEVLKGLGALINAKGKGMHQFARVGGEEFYGAMPQVELDQVDAFLNGLRSDLSSQSALIFPSLNNPLVVKKAIDDKVEAISRDIVNAIDIAISRGELDADYNKEIAIESAKQTGAFDPAYKPYMKEDLSKIKNGLIHQFVFQGITDAQGKTHAEAEWDNRNIFTLLNIASEKMNKVAVTISAGSSLLEKENLRDITPEEALVRVMNEADIAMYRSKENKNVKMQTVKYNPADREMTSKMQQVDIPSAINQITETLEGTTTINIPTNLDTLPEQRVKDYRDEVQREIQKMRALSEGDVVAGPGIYNSRGLENELNRTLMQMRQLHKASDSLTGEERRRADQDRRQRLQYVTIDLGDLKIFNDIFGHAMGDKLINVFAQTANNEIGEFGSVARNGGDEFAFLIQGTPTNAQTTLEKINKALLKNNDFQIPQGVLREKLQGLTGDARTRFLMAVRRQLLIQRDVLRAKGHDISIEILMEDSQLENLPVDVLTTWKPVFSSGIASYDANVMGNWSTAAVQKTLAIASDRAQERAKSEMRRGSFVIHTAEDIGINVATVRKNEDYAIVTAFSNTVTNQMLNLYPLIKQRTDQDLNMFPPTVPHRGSLDKIINSLEQKGVLEKGLDTYASVWKDIHDTAYRGAEIDFNDKAFEATVKDTWKTIGEAVGIDVKTSAFQTTMNDAYELLRNNSDPTSDFIGNLFIVKILGHGSIGMAINTQELMNKGIAPNEAKAMAMLAAAHHPGFPISFVEDTVLPGMGRELPGADKSALLPMLLIDMERDFRTFIMADFLSAQLNGRKATDVSLLRQQYEQGDAQKVIDNVTKTFNITSADLADVFTVKGKRETIAKIAQKVGRTEREVASALKTRRQASANYLRMKIADYVADNLGVMDRANARMHALLGYGLDRITPANPGSFEVNPLTGAIESVGGEIIDKKYGLVASSNIKDYKQMTLQEVYSRSIINVEEERDSFINAVEDMKVGLDAKGVALLDELKTGVVNEGNELIALAKADQDNAFAFINKYLRGAKTITFSGHLRDIETDIAIVENLVNSSNFKTDYSQEERSAASYLLRSLKALNNDQVKKRVAALRTDDGDLNLSNVLPAQTQLTPQEVISQWTLIGGKEIEIQAALDTLGTEADLQVLLQGLRKKALGNESKIVLDKADHLLRVAEYSIEQAERDGRSRREILKGVEDYAATTQKASRNVGGINLNANLLDLQIKRDDAGVPLPAFDQPINNMKIDGFLPVIIDIVPIQNIPLFISFNDQESDRGV